MNTFKHKVKETFLTLLREKDQDMYTMGKLPPLSPHFNHGTVIQTGIKLVLYSLQACEEWRVITCLKSF